MITLYKKGNTHIVRGVVCELKNFDVTELDFALSIGYITDESKLDEKEADTNQSGKLSVKEVRVAAKKAGISNYSKKKIDDLKKELGYED